MQKEGLHELAYSLTLDPAEEVRGALAEVTSKNWQELRSLDKILDTAEEDTLEAEVKNAPVLMTGNEANYRTDAVELPENYKDSGYHAADDDEDAEVDYSAGCPDAQKTFEKEIDDNIHFRMLSLAHFKHYVSAEHRERVVIRKIELGWAERFFLNSIKEATG